MTTLVVDASTVTAALAGVDAGGEWAAGMLDADRLVSADHMPIEVFSALRKSEHRGVLSAEAASLAHTRLWDLPIELFELELFADRVWELRDNITPYDAWYVALAEDLGCPLVTLDHRLASAPGATCEFVTPPRPRDRGPGGADAPASSEPVRRRHPPRPRALGSGPTAVG